MLSMLKWKMAGQVCRSLHKKANSRTSNLGPIPVREADYANSHRLVPIKILTFRRPFSGNNSSQLLSIAMLFRSSFEISP